MCVDVIAGRDLDDDANANGAVGFFQVPAQLEDGCRVGGWGGAGGQQEPGAESREEANHLHDLPPSAPFMSAVFDS